MSARKALATGPTREETDERDDPPVDPRRRTRGIGARRRSPARAAKNYGPGVTDTEIKIGNTGPYSGPASSYGTIPKSEAAYFRLVNDEGGVNGRKINFISYDDAYSPPKTVEQVRKLVEQDQVLLVMSRSEPRPTRRSGAI